MATQALQEMGTPLPATRRRPDWLAAAGLLAVVLIAHGGALFDGVFFDDHWHRATLRTYGWSFDDMVESATFDLPGRLNHLWWQTQPLQWRYARPAAMFFMKIEYILAGGHPVGIHAFGLLWHLVTGWLVYRLALWGIGSRGWAFLAATLFLIHPHSVFAVSWTAARNALVSGCFLVAAVLAYIAASRPDETIGTLGGQRVPLRPGMLVAALLLWAAALLARETAILFPLVAFALDGAFGGWMHLRRRLPVHGLIGLLTVVYLAWRLIVFPVSDVPEVYFHSPEGLGYLPWAASKLLQMLFALVFYSPMFVGVATGGLTATTLITHALMLAVVLVPLGLYAALSRGLPGRWFWPTWVVGAFLPVIPVFILPHFAYLPAIGYAVMQAIVLSRLRRGWRTPITVLAVAASVWSLGLYRYSWRGIVRSEQIIYADLIAETPDAGPGDRLFFINLPLVGIYAPVAAREAWGINDIEGHVLTFAPETLSMSRPGTVQVLGDRELLVSLPGGAYFAGQTGRMLLQMTRPDEPLTPGTVIRGTEFDTTILDADDSGVRWLQFTFREPLDSPRYHFYVCSPERPAARLRFDAAPGDLDADTAALFAQAREPDEQTRMQARRRIAATAAPVAVQMAHPIQTVLAEDPHLLADEHLRRVETWWRQADVSARAAETRAWRQTHARPLAESRYYHRIMDAMARIVRSDLFLTGQDAE